jgi:hypothetical protein
MQASVWLYLGTGSYGQAQAECRLARSPVCLLKANVGKHSVLSPISRGKALQGPCQTGSAGEVEVAILSMLATNMGIEL